MRTNHQPNPPARRDVAPQELKQPALAAHALEGEEDRGGRVARPGLGLPRRRRKQVETGIARDDDTVRVDAFPNHALFPVLAGHHVRGAWAALEGFDRLEFVALRNETGILSRRQLAHTANDG